MIPARSPVVQAGIRTASPLALTVAAYLFFAGHNQPGGGFAAGLVIGAVVALRAVAGLPRPARPEPWFGWGVVFMGIVALTSIAGMLGRVFSDFCYVIVDPRISFGKES